MIFGSHTLGVYGDLTVDGGAGDGSAGYLMTIRMEEDAGYEVLTRSDIERLRELCDEALS